ncbi:hypothetical protein D3C81_1575360 [compost metagenome]
MRHQVGVGDQHARRVRVRAEHADRLARLYQQRFVLAQAAQAVEDGIEAFPVARGLADAAVHHQVLRALGHVGVQVVLDHAVGGFDQPVLAVQLGTARGADFALAALDELAFVGVHVLVLLRWRL